VSLRNVFFAMAVAVCSGRRALPQAIEVAEGTTAEVFKKPPTVEVRDTTGKLVASIPIDANPDRFAFSKSSNRLYVAHDAPKSEPDSLTVVNLTTQRVDRVIKLGVGRAVEVLMSDDGHRLFCYTASSGRSFTERAALNYVPRMGFYDSLGDLKPPFEPLVSVVDTASNEVVATYKWIDNFRAAVPKGQLLASWFLAADDDGGHLAMAYQSRPLRGPSSKPFGQQLAVFSGQSPNPTLVVDPGGAVAATMFSRDKRFFFVAAEDRERHSGLLSVIDLNAGTAAKRALTDRPTKLARLGSEKGIWILDQREMRSLSETGEVGNQSILLSGPRKSAAGAADALGAEDYPGETITLGEDHAAILITAKNGVSRHRVALIDLKQFRLDSIIPTTSTGEHAGIMTGRILTAVALSAATLGTLTFIPNPLFQNEALAARPDGKFLYALDLDSHELTVVDVRTATVVVRIPVDHSDTRIQVSADGKYLLCRGTKIQKIELASNKLTN
jgi:hypothetical protein